MIKRSTIRWKEKDEQERWLYQDVNDEHVQEPISVMDGWVEGMWVEEEGKLCDRKGRRRWDEEDDAWYSESEEEYAMRRRIPLTNIIFKQLQQHPHPHPPTQELLIKQLEIASRVYDSILHDVVKLGYLLPIQYLIHTYNLNINLIKDSVYINYFL